MLTDARLLELLRRYEETLRGGQPVSPEELCRDCPEYLEEVRKNVGGLLASDATSLPTTPGAQRPDQGEKTELSNRPDGPRSPAGRPVGVPRYRPLRLHARGGLGEVHVAEDEELHRQVALKRLQAHHAHDPDSRRRFLLEAEITGRLEHPGVVTVHGLVHDSDGLPCYAMRFIEGQSLREALEEFHARDKQPGRDPGERSLALRQLLSRFIAVCNTIAYAHNRGVIHRDLKPANIMLGRYGETLVVDWGLAKPVDRTEEARSSGEDSLQPSAGPAGAGTQAGSVLGTPAFMSPEQAGGWGVGVGPASDIYNLGATLYALLTGRPPFTGANDLEVLQKAYHGDFPRPRQVKPEVPAALEAVCLKAMAFKPRDRYATALELAADLEKWLADEPVAAHREPWAVRARRWVRRHRLLVTGLATAALVVALAGGVALALVEQQRRASREQTARLVNQALGQASAFRDQARKLRGDPVRAAPLWREALAAAGRAHQELDAGEADDDTRRRAEELLPLLRDEARAAETDRAMVADLEKARELAAELEESDYVRHRPVQEFVFGRAAVPALAAAFRNYGIDVEKLPPAEAARRIAGRPIRLQLAVALDFWYFLEPGAAGGKLLEISRAADPDPLRNEVRVAIAHKDRAALKRLAARPGVVELPVPTLILLADVLHQEGLRDEGVDLLKRARLRYTGDFWVNDVLGLHLGYTSAPDYPEAARCFAAAIALRPDSPIGWSNLGNVLANEGRLDEAVSVLREAVRRAPNFAISYQSLCQCLLAQGETGAALEAVRQGLRHRPGSPMLLNVKGAILWAQGKTDEAIALYRQVLDRHPEWVGARIDLAAALEAVGSRREAWRQLDQVEKSHPQLPDLYSTRGNFLLNEGKTDEALKSFRKALALAPGAGYFWSNLGRALTAAGRYEEALKAHHQAVSLAPRDGNPRVALATTLRSQGRVNDALAECREALRLNPKLAVAHNELGLCLDEQGKFAEAEAAFREALRLLPHEAWFHANLGDALRLQKQFLQAIAAYQEAIRLRPREGWFHHELGHAYFDQGLFAEAAKHYRKAVELNPRNAMQHQHLGNVLVRLRDFPNAVKELQEAARLDPKQARVRQDLGFALWQAGKKDQALDSFRDAIRLDPRNPAYHETLGLALEQKWRFDEAGAEFREVLRLKPSDAVTHGRLGDLLSRQRRWPEAVSAYREAVHWQPKDPAFQARLANALLALNQTAEAVVADRRAVALDPRSGYYRAQLANALYRHGESSAAEAEARKAIQFDPLGAEGPTILGTILFGRGKYIEAAASYRQALAHAPRSLVLHINLANTYWKLGKLAEAEAAYRQGRAVSPLAADPHFGLGVVLLEKGRPAEAEQEFGSVLILAPANQYALAWLSKAQLAQGKVSEAVASATQAVKALPLDPRGHFQLGEALAARGSFAAALAAFGQGKRLPPPQDVFARPLPWDERIQETTRDMENDATLAALRQGKLKVVDAGELAALAQFCRQKKNLPLTAVKLYTDAFAAAPKLADDLPAGHRYSAACAAVRAAVGGEKGVRVDDAEKARLRRQALDWLRADLKGWEQQLSKAPARVREALGRWRKEPDLAGVRDKEALAQLPAAEREEWRRFWADVDGLAKRAGATKNPQRTAG